MFAGVHLHQIRIAVEMIKVFQKREVQGGFGMRRLHALGQHGGQIHRQLLVADGVLKHGFVNGLEIGQLFLLLLLRAPQHGQLPAQGLILNMPGHLMGEFNRLEFRAIH